MRAVLSQGKAANRRAAKALALFAALLGLVAYQDSLIRQSQLNTQNGQLQVFLNERAQHIRHLMTERLLLTQGLDAWVSFSGSDLSQEQFERIANLLMQGVPGVRSLQLAPGGVVRYVTNRSENSAAIGLDLFADARSSAQAEQSRRQGNVTITGPIDLVQGGQAVIVRRPIFVGARDGESGVFWGFATVLVDMDQMLESAHFPSDRALYQVALRGRHGQGAAGEVFYGEPALFDAGNPVIDIPLPAGHWQITGKQLQSSGLIPRLWAGIFGVLIAAWATRMFYTGMLRTQKINLALQQVEESEQTLNSYLRHAPDMLISSTLDGAVTGANDRSTQALGYSTAELLQMNLADLSTNYREFYARTVVEGVQSGEYVYHNDEFSKRGGGKVPVEVALTVIDMPGGKRRILAAMRDMSELYSARRMLESAQAMINDTHMVHELGPDFRFLRASEKFYQTFGYSVEDCLAASPEVIYLNRKERAADNLHARILAGEIVTTEIRRRTRKGVMLTLQSHYYPVLGEDGRLVKVTVVSLDVSTQRAMEKHWRESQKHDAIGQLVGGFAHDYNNLLGVIIGNLDMGEMQLAGQEQGVRRHLESARQAAMRGAELTRSLMTVARRQPLVLEQQELNGLLSSAEQLLHSSVGEAVHLQVRRGPGELPVKVDVPGLSAALVHLLKNSCEAAQRRGVSPSVTVETRLVAGYQGGVADDLPAGDYAELMVIDNGGGMSGEVLERACEPFFTTKDRGKATGLGLAMVRGYAKQLGGSLRIDSTPGIGTRVTLVLPLSRDTAARTAGSPACRTVSDPVGSADVPAAGRGAATLPRELPAPSARPATEVPRRILVVDDEPEQLEIAANWLDSLGYAVTTELTPAAALDRLDREPFDLLFTDVVMPGPMDGIKLAETVHERYPHLWILIASGYSATLAHDNPGLPGMLIDKPYRKNDLRRALSVVLPT